MSYFKIVSVNITVEAANDPIYEPPQPPTPASDQLRCEMWVTCENPKCFAHGCLNAQRRGHSTRRRGHTASVGSVRYV